MMEAARTSETLVNFYQTTRRYNPEDSHLRKEMYMFKYRYGNIMPFKAHSEKGVKYYGN
jgi:hypothetical protein